MERHPMFMTQKTNIKMAMLPKLIYGFSTFPIKIPADFFLEIDKLILKFIQKFKRTRLVNIILKKNKVEGLTLSNFQTYHSNQDSLVLE